MPGSLLACVAKVAASSSGSVEATRSMRTRWSDIKVSSTSLSVCSMHIAFLSCTCVPSAGETPAAQASGRSLRWTGQIHKGS